MASGRNADARLGDTHVLLWFAYGSPELGPRARALVEASVRGQNLYVSAVSAWEISLLVRKKRLRLRGDPDAWWREAGSRLRLRELPVSAAAALLSQRLPGAFHEDPADRFLVATACLQKVPLLTADVAILRWAHTTKACDVLDARV